MTDLDVCTRKVVFCHHIVLQTHVLGKCHAVCMYWKYSSLCLLVWQRKLDFAINSSWSNESRVQRLYTICGHYHLRQANANNMCFLEVDHNSRNDDDYDIVSDLDTVGIIDQADEKLLQLVLITPNHVLSSLLPDKTDQHYYLIAKCHDSQLVDKCNKLFSNNFMIRMLHTECYWFILTTFNKDDARDDDSNTRSGNSSKAPHHSRQNVVSNKVNLDWLASWYVGLMH